MLRGLPESGARLAVFTIIGGPNDQSPPPQQPLTASVPCLDFGALLPGQEATAEFDVYGGPGRVLVESDQIRVTPGELGLVPLVRVKLRPMQSGVLWTVLRFTAAGEALNLPVIAQWHHAATIDSSPAAAGGNASAVAGTGTPGMLVVSLDGGGDFLSLEPAIVRAPPGATIHLRAGTHRLRRLLKIDKPLSLVGDGMDATHAICSTKGCVVRYQGAGEFSARDIHFALIGLSLEWAPT